MSTLRQGELCLERISGEARFQVKERPSAWRGGVCHGVVVWASFRSLLFRSYQTISRHETNLKRRESFPDTDNRKQYVLSRVFFAHTAGMLIIMFAALVASTDLKL